MEEKDVKNCGDNLTIKCYLILKKLLGKEYALEKVKEAPIFKNMDI